MFLLAAISSGVVAVSGRCGHQQAMWVFAVDVDMKFRLTVLPENVAIRNCPANYEASLARLEVLKMLRIQRLVGVCRLHNRLTRACCSSRCTIGQVSQEGRGENFNIGRSELNVSEASHAHCWGLSGISKCERRAQWVACDERHKAHGLERDVCAQLPFGCIPHYLQSRAGGVRLRASVPKSAERDQCKECLRNCRNSSDRREPSGNALGRRSHAETLSEQKSDQARYDQATDRECLFHIHRPPQSGDNSPRLLAARHPACTSTPTAEGAAQ